MSNQGLLLLLLLLLHVFINDQVVESGIYFILIKIIWLNCSWYEMHPRIYTRIYISVYIYLPSVTVYSFRVAGNEGYLLQFVQLTLSVSPAPLVTVAPSDKQLELLTVLQWQLQCEKPCPTMFLHNFGHRRPQMGMKYSMEGFIKYLKINTVCNSKWGFTDHNASGRSLILRRSSRSRMTTCRINTVHVSQGTIQLMYI